MRKPNLSIKHSVTCLLVVLTGIGLLQSCKNKHRSDVSKVLFAETGNKAFKNLNSDTFAVVFKKTLESKRSTLNNPNLITAFYERNDYEPVLLLKHLPKGELKLIPDYLSRASQHGLDPQMFKYNELQALVAKVYNKTAIKSEEEAYKNLADLELTAANSLINYSSALEFGAVSPRKIYARYYTETKRPDSVSMQRIFSIGNLKSYLDSIQPKDPQYLSLQKALVSRYKDPKMTQEETQRVIDHGKSVLNMKVVVGEGRNKDFSDNLQEYDENDLKKDRPFTRETPQLNSMIHSVQVNPVWNIPQSIATNEITKQAAEDPYYLSSHNIDVYQNGKKIEDTETIDWTAGDPGKKYSFKQRPGDDNALGQIKFLFNNQSSVYLHDTPAKAGFTLPVRALSHGCVRLEKPQELAYQLFGEGEKYELIKKDMAEPNPEATTLSLPKQVPVYLTYFTAWTDESGSLQFRKDVYGLDIVLYTYLQRLSGH
jgi:murein L,D-transpeptidase YcbB/YkuD